MKSDRNATGHDDDDGHDLAAATETIARQSAELALLRQDRDAAAIVQRVRERLALADTAAAIAAPVTETRLIEMIVETATQIMLKVHRDGKGMCGVYPKDIASTKVELVLTHARKAGHPLQCVMEEA